MKTRFFKKLSPAREMYVSPYTGEVATMANNKIASKSNKVMRVVTHALDVFPAKSLDLLVTLSVAIAAIIP